MAKRVLVSHQGTGEISRAFELEFQRAVLFALRRKGLLDCVQLDRCLMKLDHTSKLHDEILK